MSLKRPRECDCTGVPEFMQNETTYIILGAENKIGSSYQIVIETGVTIRDFHYRGKKNTATWRKEVTSETRPGNCPRGQKRQKRSKKDRKKASARERTRFLISRLGESKWDTASHGLPGETLSRRTLNIRRGMFFLPPSGNLRWHGRRQQDHRKKKNRRQEGGIVQGLSQMQGEITRREGPH